MSMTRTAFIASILGFFGALLGVKPTRQDLPPPPWSPADIPGGFWLSADDPSTFEADSRSRVRRAGIMVQPESASRFHLGPWPRIAKSLVLALALLLAGPLAADDCLKVVLGHRLGCAGEAVETRELVVSVYEGRVARVERRKESTELNYTEWLERLQDKYGAGGNLDNFPQGYVEKDREHVAVALEKGRREQVWQQQGGWTIRLLWIRRGVILRYSHDQLEAAMLEAEL